MISSANVSVRPADVLSRAQQGDADAIEALVREHQSLVFNVVRKMLLDHRDAQEVAQDVFVRAIKALQGDTPPVFESDSAPRSWLLTIARNLALNRARHNRSRPVTVNDTAALARLAEPGAVGADSSDDALERAMSRLTSRDRELLALRFVSDLSYREIAAIVACSEVSARGRVFRALRVLRAMLEAEHDDL